MTLTPEKPVSQKQAGTSESTTTDSVMGQAQHKLHLSAKTDRYDHKDRSFSVDPRRYQSL